MQRLPGRYAIFFGPEFNLPAPGGPFSDHVTAALRERLGSIERVNDPAAAAGYDAVIVVRAPERMATHPGRTADTRVVSNATRTEPITDRSQVGTNTGTPNNDRQGRPILSDRSYHTDTTLIAFDIVRNGQTIETGVARIERTPEVSAIERDRVGMAPVNRTDIYSRSRTVATAVVQTLRRSAN